jgi:hypothetical protein
LFSTNAWVCSCGSPARLLRWSNTAATSPAESICSTPSVPRRDRAACRSRYARSARTAARCAATASAAVVLSPSAHSALTLLGAENVKSDPVTPSARHARPNWVPAVGCRPRANNASSSRSLTTAHGSSPSRSRPRPCQRPGASPTPRSTARKRCRSSPSSTPPPPPRPPGNQTAPRTCRECTCLQPWRFFLGSGQERLRTCGQ